MPLDKQNSSEYIWLCPGIKNQQPNETLRMSLPRQKKPQTPVGILTFPGRIQNNQETKKWKQYLYAYTHSISIAWNFPPWEPHGRKASRQIREEAESGIFLLRGPRCSTRGRVAGRTVTGVRCSGLNLLGWVRHRSCDRPQQVFDQGTECCSNLSKNYTRQTLQPLHSIWCPDDAPLTGNNHSDLRNYFYLILLTFFLQKKKPLPNTQHWHN